MAIVHLLGVPVNAQRFDEALGRLLEHASTRTSFRAHFATVHSLVEATQNAALEEAFGSASMVCTDGMPLVWLARRRGHPAERVAGPDMIQAVCDRGRQAGIRHFFIGGGEGVAQALAERLARQFPGLDVAGTYTPPFRSMTEGELADLRRQLVYSRAQIAWIGLGAPKQELFAAELSVTVPGVVILPVGAAFDFHSGRVRRAPRWMRRAGLEWLFRLSQEPGRLWRRYLATNARFIWLVAREELAIRGSRRSKQGS